MGQPITFESLKNIASNDPLIQDNLEDLKNMFQQYIGSTRNMYRIRSVADFIDCLERHDALSEYNIEILREIADEFGGKLAEVVTNYNVPRLTEPQNEYRAFRMSYECETRLHISGALHNGYSSGTQLNGNVAAALRVPNGNSQPIFAQVLIPEKFAAIQKLIANDIGTDWRCFGRELEVCQGDLDNIEINYRDLKTRVYKLFQVFEENDTIDPTQHLMKICEALDECRRKDLRRKVQKIMSH